MPKKLEDKLRKEAKGLGLTGQRFNAYVYGTLDKVKAREQDRRRLRKRKK